VGWAIVGGIAGGLLLVAMLLAVIVYLPQLAIDPRGLSRADWLKAVQDLRTTILQGLGGVALVGTLYFSARTLSLNRRGQLTERYSKAVEQLGQLGEKAMAVRLGGIYALEQIALDSERMYWPVMEVLVAFVRANPAGDATPVVAFASTEERPRYERDRAPIEADLQAALTVLARRPEERRRWERNHERMLNLRFADLRRARLRRAHLEDTLLTGARLDDADLAGVHLERAHLSGASLRHAYMRDAHLEQSVLHGARLEEAVMPGARMVGADLTGAHLDRTDLTRSQLEEARIDGSTILPSHLLKGSEPADSDRQ
jgi:hypothetical protein